MLNLFYALTFLHGFFFFLLTFVMYFILKQKGIILDETGLIAGSVVLFSLFYFFFYRKKSEKNTLSLLVFNAGIFFYAVTFYSYTIGVFTFGLFFGIILVVFVRLFNRSLLENVDYYGFFFGVSIFIFAVLGFRHDFQFVKLGEGGEKVVVDLNCPHCLRELQEKKNLQVAVVYVPNLGTMYNDLYFLCSDDRRKAVEEIVTGNVKPEVLKTCDVGKQINILSNNFQVMLKQGIKEIPYRLGRQ